MAGLSPFHMENPVHHSIKHSSWLNCPSENNTQDNRIHNTCPDGNTRKLLCITAMVKLKLVGLVKRFSIPKNILYQFSLSTVHHRIIIGLILLFNFYK